MIDCLCEILRKEHSFLRYFEIICFAMGQFIFQELDIAVLFIRQKIEIKKNCKEYVKKELKENCQKFVSFGILKCPLNFTFVSRYQFNF